MTLVSVVVITYNSAKTVIETLESIKAQSYQNIELIVSDDCSNDNTVDLVREWLELKGSRFVNTEIVTTGKNTGVAGNINRGVAKSHGEWIKSIAGDDLLIPTAIEEYISFIATSKERVRMCVSDVECFSESDVAEELLMAYKNYFEKEKESFHKQKKRVCTELCFVGPTFFYSRELYNEIGGFLEKYGNAEEWPFVYKVIMQGNRIYAIDNKLVRYRIQNDSLCRFKDKKGLGNHTLFMNTYKFFFDYPFKYLLRTNPLVAWHYCLAFLVKRIQYRVSHPFIRKSIGFGWYLLSPLSYWKGLRMIVKGKSLL